MNLKPCPFCGSADVQIEEIEGEMGVRKSAGCMTEECHGYQSTLSFATRREAVKAWNERAIEKKSRRLRQLLRQLYGTLPNRPAWNNESMDIIEAVRKEINQ